jgi:hypothetical protein
MPAAGIRFINKSLSPSPVDVVFFEPPGFFDSQTVRVPWYLIEHCSYYFSHPFRYDFSLTMHLRDDWGNYSPPVKAQPGMCYTISGKKAKLHLKGPGNPDEIKIHNESDEDAPGIVFKRGGNDTAIRTHLAPGESFSFRIPHTLLARKVSGTHDLLVQQFQDPRYCSPIELKGIQTADLVLTGGGSGAFAKKYSFTLQNKKTY